MIYCLENFEIENNESPELQKFIVHSFGVFGGNFESHVQLLLMKIISVAKVR